MEDYNQKSLNDTIRLTDALHGIDAKYVKQYYDYYYKGKGYERDKSEEDRINVYEVVSQYRRNARDPKRGTGYVGNG